MAQRRAGTRTLTYTPWPTWRIEQDGRFLAWLAWVPGRFLVLGRDCGIIAEFDGPENPPVGFTPPAYAWSAAMDCIGGADDKPKRTRAGRTRELRRP